MLGADRFLREIKVAAGLNHPALASSAWAAEADEGRAIEVQVGLKQSENQVWYELWDRTGKPIPNLRPDLEAAAPAAGEIVKRLEHLSRYRAVEQLECYEGTSPLAGKVLRIRNLSAQKLNVAVLDLQPDWGISQIYPGSLSDFVELEAGKELPLIPLKADLPQDYAEGRDVVKVMASIGPANFRMLCLPALDAPLQRSAERALEQHRSATPGRTNPLETLFTALTADAPRTRTLTAITDPTTEWTTASVELRVCRRAR